MALMNLPRTFIIMIIEMAELEVSRITKWYAST
jgi:hypothetical protein